MRFEIVERYGAPVQAVRAAFADPALYAAMRNLPGIGAPEVVAHEPDGERVHLEVRMHFTGHLSAAARAVIDPTRLSWITVTDHDLATGTVTFTLRPDHYADRFRCAGSYTLHDAGNGSTVRTLRGDLSVRVLLVREQVERAIVSGLKEHMQREAGVVERFANEA